MPSALELVEKEASARIAAANRRRRTESLEMTLVRKGSVLSTAALYGTLNRYKVPIEIGGFPWKLGVGALATLGEGLSKGVTQSILAGVSDATMAIYTERSISQNTLIAGDDTADDDDDDDDDDDGGEV